LLARLGRARALERLAARDDFEPSRLEVLKRALAAYDDIKKIAVLRSEDLWKHVEADNGRARILLQIEKQPVPASAPAPAAKVVQQDTSVW
jgi:hypothetical protein